MTTASSIQAAETAYLDNADYAEDLSITKARKFITACRKLLLAPSSMTKGANTVSNRIDLIHDQLKEAQIWLEKHSADDISGPLVTKTDFRGFRRSGF